MRSKLLMVLAMVCLLGGCRERDSLGGRPSRNDGPARSVPPSDVNPMPRR